MATIKQLNPFQHALQRPDTYVGSVKTVEKEVWIFDPTNRKIIPKTITYNRALEKIFAEIISNAIDNKWRSEKIGLVMKKIEITMDPPTGEITVLNDGKSISAVKEIYEYEDHRSGEILSEERYPAEVCFGEMLAGSNFDDSEKRKTSGRNGIGAKATNIFSTLFVVDHADEESGFRFVQTYKNNAKVRGNFEVTPYSKKSYTKITFIPDYERLHYDKTNPDLISLFKRHACECSMITGLDVMFNGEKISVRNLTNYVALYGDQKSITFKSQVTSDECVLVESNIFEEEDTRDTISHFSFINGINTSQGGEHVNAWKDAIIGALVRTLNSRKNIEFKASAKDLYPYFLMFVRAEVDNPEFDTQTKDFLISPKISIYKDKRTWIESLEKSMKKMLKWDFVQKLDDKLEERHARILARKEKVKSKGRPKDDHLTDANWAGGPRSMECCLYITEGDGAKTLAIAGATSRDSFDTLGALAIKGNFINAEKVTLTMLEHNKEANLLKKTLGLDSTLKYETKEEIETLRYGKVVLFTDADLDGIHIRGLLLNFFYRGWPALLRNGYVQAHLTAVIEVKMKSETLYFYTLDDFSKWSKENSNKKYAIKYNKGLGSIRPSECSHYFDDPKLLTYIPGTDEIVDKNLMDLGFCGTKDWITKRKGWITDFMDAPSGVEEVVNKYEGDITVTNFINNHLILFHVGSLERAIPSMYDGFKRSQRQIFYGLIRNNSKDAIELESLAGQIKSITNYHHGTPALMNAIVGMAQGFVGSNNIPLLEAVGNFGSRLEGGDDAAPARYISTKLENITRYIFPEIDEALYIRRVEDMKEVEYECFIPILPIILINGANGIACGYSTTVPCYNPLEISAKIRAWLKDPGSVIDKENPLKPWYRGFTGSIEIVKTKQGKSWLSKGKLEKDNQKKDVWHIRELPVGKWTITAKAQLEYLETGVSKHKKKGESYIRSIDMFNTLNTVHFSFKAKKDFIPDETITGNMKEILQTRYSLNNMIVLDSEGRPRKYDTPEELILDFCEMRYKFYSKRKNYLLSDWKRTLKIHNNKYKFIKCILDKTINLDTYKTEEEENSALMANELEPMSIPVDKPPSYNYLLDMPISHMKREKLLDFEKRIAELRVCVTELETKTEKDLWIEDLDAFETQYQKFLKTRKDDAIPTKKKAKKKAE